MNQVVVVGDLHANFWKPFSKGEGLRNSRFLKTLENLQASLEKAQELKAPWIQAGDWVHTVGFARNPIINALIAVLNQYPDVDKYTVWGNHDSRTAGGLITLNETVPSILQSAVRNFTVLEGDVPGMGIYGEGYQPDHSMLKINSSLADPSLIGVFHGSVEGSALPSGITISSGIPKDLLFDNFQLSIVGDIHLPQVFEDKKTGHKILVPGSLEPHNFGDSGERGWWVCSVDPFRDPTTNTDRVHVDFQFHRSTSPQFITVVTAAEVKQDGNFYRVTSPCRPEDLPEGSIALSTPPQSIPTRERLIPDGASTRDILENWMALFPPPAGKEECLTSGLSFLEGDGPSVLRPIRLRCAILTNFLCYADAPFDLDDGVTLVTGQSRDFSSNGAGKTTLFEAIFWALFGRTTKGVGSEEVIQRGFDSCAVELLLDDLRVRRTRNRDGTSTLEVMPTSATIGEDDWVDPEPWGGTPKEVTTQLQKYLGLTPELYQALAYFSQSRLILFSQASDSERKTMLSDLCGLDIYQKAATAARTSTTRLEQEISQVSAQLTMYESGVAEEEERRNGLVENSKKWDVQATKEREHLNEAIVRDTKCIGDLEQRWYEVQEKMSIRSIRCVERVADLRPQIEQDVRNCLRTSLCEVQARYEEWKSKLDPLPDREILVSRGSELFTEIGNSELLASLPLSVISTNASLINHSKEKIKGLLKKGDTCPACGQSIDVSGRDRMIAEEQESISRMNQEVQEARAEEQKIRPFLDDNRAKIKQINELITEVDRRSVVETSFLDEIGRAEKNLEPQVTSRVDEKMRYERGRVRDLFVFRKIRYESRVAGRLLVLGAQRTENETRLKKATVNPWTDELGKSENLLRQKKELHHNALQTVMEKTAEKDIMMYWTTAFSRGGIQSLLIDEIAAAFNQIRSLIFPTLTGGVYDAQFATTSQTKEGEAREKTDFVIRNREALVTYESLSGGERRRIDLGVMLTLILAVARTRRVPGILGLLVLDEVVSFLDEDGVEALYETLLEVQKTIPSIYVITHISELKSLFEKSILIEQDQHGVSRLITVPGVIL